MPRPELEQAHEPDPPPSAGPRGAVRRPRRLAWLLGLTGLAAVLTWVGVDRWARGELMRVERELKRGEIGAARVRLDRLGMLRLGGLEAEYWRGACEEAEGDVDAALALWGRIPAGSSRFANATLRRARLAIDRGRLAVAEATLERTRGVFPPGSTRPRSARDHVAAGLPVHEPGCRLAAAEASGSGHHEGQGRRAAQALADRRDLGLSARGAPDPAG